MSYCPHCKTNEGPHFVPPCTGDPGFFVCMTPGEIALEFERYDKDSLANYAPGSPRYVMSSERLRLRRQDLQEGPMTTDAEHLRVLREMLKRCERMRNDPYFPTDPAEEAALTAAIGRWERDDEAERLQVQLAGCLTAAECLASDPAHEGDYGWSLAYQRTLDLRIRYEALRERLAGLREQVKKLPCVDLYDRTASNQADQDRYDEYVCRHAVLALLEKETGE